MNVLRRLNIVCGISMLLAYSAFSNVTLNRLFASNMVVQHGMPVPVWGTASAGESVSVQFDGQTKTVVTPSNGSWKVILDSMSIDTIAQQIVVKGANTITLGNVLIGDVWYCTGQSNMQFNLSAFGYNATTEAVGMSNVRLLTQTDTNGTWNVCSASTAGGFSATAFFFGKYLYDSVKVPLGLICSGVGATFIWQWMSPQSVTADGDPALASASCPSCGGDTTGGINGKVTSGLYLRYIATAIPLAVKGIIWYQGEWDANDNNWCKSYLKHLQELVSGWRTAWNIGNVPFYYVQLPGYAANSGNWPLVRESERLGLKSISNTGMAITIDIGDSASFHPTDKRDVGYRVALVALEKSYGHQNMVGSGPLFKSFYVSQDTAHLAFDYIGTGLVSKNGSLNGFEIAPKDSDFTAASAIIRGNEVLAFKAGSKVTNVRYAWVPYPSPAVRLFNQQNLPASPFRTYASDVVAISEVPNGRPAASGVAFRKISSLKIFDVEGRCLLVACGNDLAGLSPGDLTAGSLARLGRFSKGIYIVQMKRAGETETIRKIVQR